LGHVDSRALSTGLYDRLQENLWWKIGIVVLHIPQSLGDQSGEDDMNIAHLSRVKSAACVSLVIIGTAALTDLALAQVDPGVRGGPPGAGGPLPGLNGAELKFFTGAQSRFQEVDSVSGTIAGEAGVGLGPRFNLNGCAGCHAQPAVGGSSPPVNPQIAVATLDGAHNTVPSFISLHGPVREARFVNIPSTSTPDGGVHDLFVISGRTDAPGCNITQPDFATQLAANNVIFRIPTPLFGLGLVENVPDATLIADSLNISTQQALNGIQSGIFNHSGNDGTITRFGWKAQNKTLLIFAGEAYNVEQGVTNEAFANEREGDPNCQFNGTPEDSTVLGNTPNSGSKASDFSSDIVNFAGFARLSAAPVPVAPPTTNGALVFTAVGCQLCHIQILTTAKSPFAGQSNVSFQPFSDFALHHMGTKLADGISQGNATGDQFRTAPLWGIGQRIFFLHDGRTNDLLKAIQAHASPGSEANAVISAFNGLTPQNKQDPLNFLRSL